MAIPLRRCRVLVGDGKLPQPCPLTFSVPTWRQKSTFGGRELELLSVQAGGSEETCIYLEAVQTPNALLRGELLSFICSHFLLPE